MGHLQSYSELLEFNEGSQLGLKMLTVCYLNFELPVSGVSKYVTDSKIRQTAYSHIASYTAN